jgi:hypothetical protein
MANMRPGRVKKNETSFCFDKNVNERAIVSMLSYEMSTYKVNSSNSSQKGSKYFSDEFRNPPTL